MERKAIYFDGDVTLLDLEKFIKKIPDSGVTDIVIGGSLLEDVYGLCEEIYEVPANLWVLKDIVRHAYGTIKVHGDLYCAGVIDAYDFIVKGDFTCERDVDIANAEVGGDTTFKGNVIDNCVEIKTLGDFICYGNCVAFVLVGGSFLCEGELTGDVIKI